MLQIDRFIGKFNSMKLSVFMSGALPFNEKKATQAAAYLLKLGGGTMNYMKLIKLLYLADRKALLIWRRPITTDQCVSMKCGPVLSQIYDFIKKDGNTVWEKAISRLGQYDVSLKHDPGDDALSEADTTVLDEIFWEYGEICSSRLVDVTHELPEWKDPGRGATPIRYSDILKAEGADKSEVEMFEEELINSRNAPDVLRRIEDQQDIYVAEHRLRHPVGTYSAEEVKRELGL